MAMHNIDPRKIDNTDIEVGRLIRALRMSRGMSQTELANQLGVTFQQVQKYESGVNRMSMGRLARAAKLFRVSVPYLLDGSKQASARSAAGRESQALEMLGLIGANRLLRAFAAIPSKPAILRQSIVMLVEATAMAAAHGKGMHKRSRR